MGEYLHHCIIKDFLKAFARLLMMRCVMVFQIKIGSDVRQIISGVAEFFTPEECVGKKVLVVANLKPRKLRGLESNGMLMFADNGGRFEFMTTIARDGEIVS